MNQPNVEILGQLDDTNQPRRFSFRYKDTDKVGFGGYFPSTDLLIYETGVRFTGKPAFEVTWLDKTEEENNLRVTKDHESD